MPTPFDFEYDVFLSHSSKDKPIVRLIAERLFTLLSLFGCITQRHFLRIVFGATLPTSRRSPTNNLD
jgi:hypothetical protein